MGAPTIIAVNLTASPIVLTQLGVVIPASGSASLSDVCFTYEIQNDIQLRDLVLTGNVVVNDGSNDLNQAESLQFLTAVATTVDLQQEATASNPGYMPASAASKLDGVEAGATNTPLSNSNPSDVTRSTAQAGTAAEAARVDHKHNVEVGSPVDVGTSNAMGAGTSVALASHVHNLPFSTVASVLGTAAGANQYVFRSDGAGSGTMVPNSFDIEGRLTVGVSGDVNYTSIKSAVDYATSQGGVWLIEVYPGTYTEDPFTVSSDIRVMAAEATDRTDMVLVTANNSAADLITMTGGYIGGLELEGVTDPSYALVRCATASSLCIMHGISVRKCSTGVDVSNGATAILTNPSVNIDAAGIGVTTGFKVSGSGSYMAVSGGFFSVPSAVLPAYATNPVQDLLRVSGACKFTIVGATADIACKTNDAKVLNADDGAECVILSCEVRNAGVGAYIGSAGTGTTIVAQGGLWKGNYRNGKCDSSTGVFLVSAASGYLGFEAVAGTVLSGLIQVLTEARTYLAGNVSYQYPTQWSVDLQKIFHDITSAAVSEGGVVTAGTGLTVDVTAGDGWVVRHTPQHDSKDVSWDAASGVALTASTTNYVVYDSASDQIIAQTGTPSELQVALAVVVTDGSGIRFLHTTRTELHNLAKLLQDYLIDTRKIVWKTGLAVTQGTGNRNLTVSTGSWYRALDLLSVTGGSDVTFSIFYGTDGASEITSQTQLNNTQYDNAGTLTTMTTGYYRADTLVVTSDGRWSVILGTAEFANSDNAKELTNVASIPSFMQETACQLALVVVQQGAGIVTDGIVDIRPTGAATSSGGGGTGNHSALSNLDQPGDHLWAALVDGTRAFTGNIDIGNNDIQNVGLVDGVDVSAHATRHNPGGVDALATGTPGGISVGASASGGSAASLARSDHVHSVSTGIPSSVGQTNQEGTSSAVARLDHTHAGLVRDANDFNSFTQKTSVADDDVFIIEDSAASGVKKYVRGSALPGNNVSLAITQARRTTALTTTTAWQTVTYDTTDVQSDSNKVEHSTVTNPSRITVKEAGYYELKYQFEVSPTSTGTISGRILKNGTTVVAGSAQESITYSGESDILSITVEAQLAVNDYVEVQNQLSTSGTLRANATFSVLKLEGAQGPAGSGSSLTLRSGGVDVPGTPHTALNFQSGDFTVTNDGSGQATVALATGGSTDVKMFDVSQSVAQTLSTVVTTFPFNASPNVTDGSTFSWDGVDEVTILRAGVVSVAVGLTIQQTAGNGRTITSIGLDYQPSGGSYSVQTVRRMYTRNSSDGDFSSTQLVKNFQVSVGDKFRVLAQITSGIGTIVALASEADFSLTWAPG